MDEPGPLVVHTDNAAGIALTQHARPATHEVTAVNEAGEQVVTHIAGEHPLTLYLDKRELVTLMTLGAAPEYLALGYLRNQRLVGSAAQIAAVQVDWSTGSVAVTSRLLNETGQTVWENDNRQGGDLASRLDRKTVTSGCGQGSVFGDLMDHVDQIQLPDHVSMGPGVLQSVLEQVRTHDTIYKSAGAVHGCALCSNDNSTPGAIEVFVEDVGRHNAVDAIAGWMWANDVSGGNKIFYTTGRLTSEMVIKCAQMGVPFLVSRSGLTQMGHDIARQVGITMLGRCRGRHYLLFTGAHRFRGPGDSDGADNADDPSNANNNGQG